MRIRSKQVRGGLNRVANTFGFDATELTDRDALSGLLQSLYPIDAGRDLIRIGPVGDGGYLLPDDLDGIQYAFSPGVSDESGFEADLASRGVNVFLADASVDGPAEKNELFTFDKKFVGAFTDETFMTLDDWKNHYIPDYPGDLLLQMDIEGFEYETLTAASARLTRQFRIVVLEIHFLEQLSSRPWFDVISRFFEMILSTHSVVHNHPNNCCGLVKCVGLEIPRIIELTLYRNDRIPERNYVTQFPHSLDADNTPKATLPLPQCWYSSDR